METIQLGTVRVGTAEPLAWILGPCVMESESLVMEAAATIADIMGDRPWVFKSSYDKANRTSGKGFRGPGIHEGLALLERVKQRFGVPVLTDVHSPEEAAIAAEVVDVLQIPAFLCRQTDLVLACARSGRAVNIKKGQFLAPWDMSQIVQKITAEGNRNILLTDRGTSFGYQNLVVDFRGLPMMQQTGFPVCLDATHACQLPGGQGSCSGGLRQYVPTLARAGVAAGARALFIETHPRPEEAKSDAATQWPLNRLKQLVVECEAIASCLATLTPLADAGDASAYEPALAGRAGS
jgi:2-dehydro-3-deoxyphosphooctonate aldolase (KDO 8-P synthase)